MDDFFLQPKQRTKERLEQAGGNVDYKRFKKEIVHFLTLLSVSVPLQLLELPQFVK